MEQKCPEKLIFTRVAKNCYESWRSITVNSSAFWLIRMCILSKVNENSWRCVSSPSSGLESIPTWSSQQTTGLAYYWNLMMGKIVPPQHQTNFNAVTHHWHENLNPTHVHERAVLLLILVQLNPLYDISFHFIKIHLHIICHLVSLVISSYVFLCQSHRPWPGHPKDAQWRAKIRELQVPLPSASCDFVSVRSRYITLFLNVTHNLHYSLNLYPYRRKQ
jgi:hypothetical protein